jgi:uncharacterized protein (TIGR00369 family)
MDQATADQIRTFIEQSPFAARLGLRIDALYEDHASLRLPFHPSLATYAKVVHGGATATLIDVAATAAAWTSPREPPTGGATVDATVHYLRPAKGADLVATAEVAHRGRSLCTVRVEVEATETEGPIATALVTYKLQSGDGR